MNDLIKGQTFRSDGFYIVDAHMFCAFDDCRLKDEVDSNFWTLCALDTKYNLSHATSQKSKFYPLFVINPDRLVKHL